MIKTSLLQIIFVIIITIILSLLQIKLPNNIIATLYTGTSIIFSILLSVTISFNLENVKDNRFIIFIRNKIYSLQRMFIIYFIIATVIVAVNEWNFELYFFKSNIFYICTLVFIILFFAINFLKLQKLKDEILNRTHNINNN